MNKIYNNLNIENFIKTDEFKKLTEDQKEELLMSSQWFNQFDKKQKKLIVEGLQENLDVFLYAKTEYNWGQMAHLKAGLKKNLDISIYANPDFNNFQMNEIRLGLEQGLDVSVYAKTEFDCGQMKKNRLKLLKKRLKKMLTNKNNNAII